MALTAAGLTNAGRTTHYQFKYDDSLVQLTENAPVPGVIITKTDAAGNYSITMDPGPFDGTYTIRITAPGFTSNGTTLQKISNGAILTLNFTLEQQGVLTGHVRDQRGPAIAGAKITAGTVETFTGIDGAYSVAVDPGQFTVTASAPEFNTVTETAQVPIGQSVTLDFLLAATIPGSVAGRVTDDGGTPLFHARVAALNTSFTTTDANGQYTLTNLQPVPTQMVASRGIRFIPDQEIVNIVSGQTVTQDFVLVAKGGTIRVKAQAAAKGAVAAS